jgi:DNA polymerase III subunit delta
MKLAPRDLSGYFRQPDPDRPGVLIYGADAMRVALRRQELIAALIGPEGEAEMRLTRMSGAEVRRDPALLLDAVKAQGFFPGPRVAFVEEAGDGLAEAVGAALAEWRPGDAQLVVTAGALRPASSLRKLFEKHPQAYAAAIYDDPPGRDEIEAMLKSAGLGQVGREAMADLTALARQIDPGDLRQTVEKIALYKHGDATPLTPEEVAACAPASIESGIDDILHEVAETRPGRIGPVMRRLQGQGVNAVAICIGATRHFRLLHAASADPANAGRLWATVRHFRTRERMQKQARAWTTARLEQALGVLVETDLALRSSTPAPAMAVMERTLIRLAMLGQARK